jgi:hypothetical protein
VSEFLGAVAAFQLAAQHHDEDAVQQRLTQLRYEFGQASDEELDIAAGLLADVLPDLPLGRDAIVAVLVGACLERGAGAASCAEPILSAAERATEGAADFLRRWPAGWDHPRQIGEVPPPSMFEQLGDPKDPAVRAAGMGWWTLPLWQSAVAAVLSSKEVRKAFLPNDEFFWNAREVAMSTGVGTYLAQALAVLDDVKLVVIHRPTLEGFEFQMSGVADNFQLHTLLEERLVTPGHLPGTPPSPEAVAACSGASAEAPYEYDGTGSFNLVAPDGSWIWNEAWPVDIPVVGRGRLLILDPPPYERTWHAARAFLGMRAELSLERRISEDGVKRLMADVSPPQELFPTSDAEPSAHHKRHWWHRRELRQAEPTEH